MSDFFDLFIFPLIIIIVFTVGYFFYFRARRKLLNKLIQRWKGKIKFNPLGLSLSYKSRYQGKNFSVILIPPTRYSPAELRLIFIGKYSFRLNIVKENKGIKLFKKIGFLREIEIDDTEFNKKFLIRTDNKIRAINFLNKEAVKEAIRFLFNYGFDCFKIDEKKIFLKINGYGKTHLDPDRIEEVLEKITFLIKEVS